LPPDLDERFVSPNPKGRVFIAVKEDGTARFDIELEGLAEGLVLTAWTSYFFPGGPAPHPIFEPLGDGLPAIAGVSAPLAPTYAAFTEGLGPEPNQFDIKASGRTHLRVELDYNPLEAGQGPLRNDLVITQQGAAPPGSVAFQPHCCPIGLPAPALQPVGSSYLRLFDPNTGYQEIDDAGRPVLLRSPLPVAFIALVVHTDETTHGINPGLPILPMPGLSATTGDHFLLGIFDLRAFHHNTKGQEAEGPENATGTLEESGYHLSGVYPNPFNPTTVFQLEVATAQQVRIAVVDLLGRTVAQIFDGRMEADRRHLFTFDADHLASGKYFIDITGEAFRATRHISLIK
jgi:hypothetical protein